MNNSIPDKALANSMKFFAVFIASIFSVASITYAQTVEVNVRAQGAPVKITGMLISSKGVTEKNEVKSKRLSDGTLVISIPFSRSELEPDTVATAMVETADGSRFFADIKPTTIPEIRESFLNLPACDQKASGQPFSAANIESGLGYMELLVVNRLKQRDQIKERVGALMKGDYLNMLRKLETGFGFSYAKDLNADLSPFELYDRLYRLQNALSNYQLHR